MVAYVVAVVVSTAFLFAGGAVVALHSPQTDAWLGLAAVSVSILAIVPLIIGSLAANWKVDAAPETRVIWRRWRAVALTCEVVAAGLIIAWTVGVGAPWWIPISAIVVSVLLLVAAPFIGTWVRRSADARAASRPAAPPLTPAKLRRRIAAIPITFVVTLAAALTLVLVFLPGDEGERDWWTTILAPLAAAFIAAGVAAVIGTLAVSRELQATTKGDFGLTRRLSKAIVGRKPVQLTDAERVMLPDYAVALYRVTAFQLAFFALLYGGLALNQALAWRRDDNLFPLILLIAMLGLVIAAVVFSLRTMGRARRFLAAQAPTSAEPVEETVRPEN